MRFTVEHHGCTLVGESRGDGPVVVMLHGAGMNRLMFDAQVTPIVEAGFRVVTFDMRGHGESARSVRRVTAELLEADTVGVMDAEGIDEAFLVGQSLGGNVAQSVARRHPDRVKGLAVIDSAWNAGPVTRMEGVQLRLATLLLALFPWPWVVRAMATASAATDAGRALALHSFGSMTRAQFLSAWGAAVAEVGEVSNVPEDRPMVLICGALDGTGKVVESMSAWAEETRVSLHMIEGAGHLSNVDKPQAVNEVLCGFLRKHGQGISHTG